MRKYLIILMPFLSTLATAEERKSYSAHDTIKKAQIGTFSPRLAQPVRVELATKHPSGQFDRLDCRLTAQNKIVCRPRIQEKVTRKQ